MSETINISQIDEESIRPDTCKELTFIRFEEGTELGSTENGQVIDELLKVRERNQSIGDCSLVVIDIRGVL